MTAGAGVPVTRDEMDSLLGELSGYLEAASRSDVTAEELRDRAEEARFTCDVLRQRWEIAALAAASGPDAGTGERNLPLRLKTLKQATAPERIYLHGCTDAECEQGFDECDGDGGETTWDTARQHVHDVEYLRADLAAPASAQPAGSEGYCPVCYHPIADRAECAVATCPGAPASGAAPEEPIWDAKTPDPEAENDPSLSDEEWAKVEAEMDAERAAAPEERDGELETPTASLEALLDSYRHALMDRVRGRPDGGVTLRSEAYAERRAIHAHVEQQKRAAREAGFRQGMRAEAASARDIAAITAGGTVEGRFDTGEVIGAATTPEAPDAHP